VNISSTVQFASYRDAETVHTSVVALQSIEQLNVPITVRMDLTGLHEHGGVQDEVRRCFPVEVRIEHLNAHIL